MALRLHPDKADGVFWTDDRKHRLTSAFQYANNVQEQATRFTEERKYCSDRDCSFANTMETQESYGLHGKIHKHLRFLLYELFELSLNEIQRSLPLP